MASKMAEADYGPLKTESVTFYYTQKKKQGNLKKIYLEQIFLKLKKDGKIKIGKNFTQKLFYNFGTHIPSLMLNNFFAFKK